MTGLPYAHYAQLTKIFGHQKRLELFCLLHGHSLTVNQIVQMTNLRQSAVSQHLMLAKKVGLVEARQEGKEVYYTLNPKVLTELSTFFRSLTFARPVSPSEPSVTDPICHMRLTPSTAHSSTLYNGVRHYFCGQGCYKTFLREHA